MRNPEYLFRKIVKLYKGVKDISYKQLSNDLLQELEQQLGSAEDYASFVHSKFQGTSAPIKSLRPNWQKKTR